MWEYETYFNEACEYLNNKNMKIWDFTKDEFTVC